MLQALLLFGSRARGDQNLDSDVDILGVTSDSEYHAWSQADVGFRAYPATFLKKLCRDGGLFALHLVLEARALYDPSSFLEQMQKGFVFKSSYSEDVAKASDLGWFIASIFDEFTNPVKLNKRIAWTVRTILIARSADARQPAFSRAGLLRLSNSTDADYLIGMKDSIKFESGSVRALTSFLRKFGSPSNAGQMSVDEAARHFQLTGNRIARKAALEISGVEELEVDDYPL